MISKIETNEKSVEALNTNVPMTFKETLNEIPVKADYVDRSSIGIYKTQNKPYDSVMKNLAERIKG